MSSSAYAGSRVFGIGLVFPPIFIIFASPNIKIMKRMSKFIKIAPQKKGVIWLNVNNIVAIYEDAKDDNLFTIVTNAVDGDGDGISYKVEGSVDIFLDIVEAELKSFL